MGEIHDEFDEVDQEIVKEKEGVFLVSGRADIDDLRFHDLRHEAISRMVERGLSVMEVASISGHKSVTMLARYSHPSPRFAAAVRPVRPDQRAIVPRHRH